MKPVRFLLPLLACLLSACATPHWVKPEASKSDLAEDQAACRLVARDWFGLSLTAVIFSRVRSCTPHIAVGLSFQGAAVAESPARKRLGPLQGRSLTLRGFTQCGVAQADNRHANNGNKNLTGFLTQQDSCGWQLDSPRDAGAPSVVVAVWQLPSRKCSAAPNTQSARPPPIRESSTADSTRSTFCLST